MCLGCGSVFNCQYAAAQGMYNAGGNSLGNLGNVLNGGYQSGGICQQIPSPSIQLQYGTQVDIRAYMQDYHDRMEKEAIEKKEMISPTTKPKTTMNVTKKTYLVVVPSTGAQHPITDFTEAKAKAAELAHITQASVLIFRPILAIEPKRDVVETEITLGE